MSKVFGITITIGLVALLLMVVIGKAVLSEDKKNQTAHIDIERVYQESSGDTIARGKSSDDDISIVVQNPFTIEAGDDIAEDSAEEDVLSEEIIDETADEASSDEEVGEDESVDADEVEAEGEEEITDDNKEEKNRVDLIFFMGQSNMAGYGGDAGRAPVVSPDAGEEYRVISDPEKLNPIKEPFGFKEDNPDGLQDKPDMKKGSLVSAFVNEYHELTGNKVIAVSNAVGGMAMDLWLIDAFWDDSVNRVKKSVKYLRDNDYEIDHIYMVWYQGESDAQRAVEPKQYRTDFYKFMNSLTSVGVEQIFLIVPRRSDEWDNRIFDLQEEICEIDDYFSLGSTKPTELGEKYQWDGMHFNQEALNIIGKDTADAVAEYTKKHN